MEQVKMSRKEKNELKRREEMAAREAERKAAFEAEKNKVRAMTFEELVTEAQQRLSIVMGLRVHVHYTRDEQAQLEPRCGLRDEIILGFTTISKCLDGSYIVGGSWSGCFMYGENGPKQAIDKIFKDLEDRANAEKT